MDSSRISKEEILIIGEILHMKMQNNPSLIKDRKHLHQTYGYCFVGKELVEWLVKTGEAVNQMNAVACIQILQDHGIIHHVNDELDFKNENLLYCFRVDDGTFFVEEEYDIYHQAIMIHQRILGDSENVLITDHMIGDKSHKNCFIASQFVNWLVMNDAAYNHLAAINLARKFLEVLIIKPVNKDASEFFGDNTLYRFVFDVNVHVPLYRLINAFDNESNSNMQLRYFNRLTLHDVNPKTALVRFWKEVWKDIIDTSAPKISDYKKKDTPAPPQLKPVVIREVTVEELISDESPYYSKDISIISDSAGFGFIIRGNGPCYVQAVDPTSPAAEAGLKVRMYIYSVNGKVVLNMDYTEVSKEIVKRNDVVDLVILQHLRSSS